MRSQLSNAALMVIGGLEETNTENTGLNTQYIQFIMLDAFLSGLAFIEKYAC